MQKILDGTTAANSNRVIRFDHAEVVAGIANGTYFLVVSGQAPCMNMDVRLVPLIYAKCPEFWGIEVVGTVDGGFCLTAVKDFTATIPLAGIVGSKGIEVIGSDNTMRFPVDGGCEG